MENSWRQEIYKWMYYRGGIKIGKHREKIKSVVKTGNILIYTKRGKKALKTPKLKKKNESQLNVSISEEHGHASAPFVMLGIPGMRNCWPSDVNIHSLHRLTSAFSGHSPRLVWPVCSHLEPASLKRHKFACFMRL